MVGFAFLLAAARPHVGVFERRLRELAAHVEEVGEGEGEGQDEVGLREAFGGVVGDGVGEFVGEDGGEAGFGGADGEDAWGGGGSLISRARRWEGGLGWRDDWDVPLKTKTLPL